jgi:hypothetical protein
VYVASFDRAGGELSERLEEDKEDNNREARLLTVSFASQLPWAPAQAGVPTQPAEGGRPGLVPSASFRLPCGSMHACHRTSACLAVFVLLLQLPLLPFVEQRHLSCFGS